MASTSHGQHVSTQAAIAGQVETRSDPRGGRIRPWVNWTLALLTVPAAVVVVLVGLGVFMSDAACSAQACPTQGPSGIWLEIVWFGSAVVAAVTVIATFFTARRRFGFVVPLCAWALIAADVALLISYAQP
jgi:hypothetical protein